MLETLPKIALVCGSLRKDSINKKLEAALAMRLVSAGGEPVIIDLGDYDLPLYHGDLDTPKTVQKLIDDIKACNGVIIVTPEYNGGLPPVLKNAIDWTSTVEMGHITGKVYGMASCTPGPMSGIMGLRLLQFILMRLGADLVPTQVGCGGAATAFSKTGELIAEPASGFADKMIAQMLARIAQKR